jgi:pyridoxamine 5'-phosphate oxidase
MDIKDCIKFANDNPVCYLATVEGDQPRVRALLFWFADKTGFYFQSGTFKEHVDHLKINPKAEACFYNNDPKDSVMLRVAGKVEFLDNEKLKRKAFEDRPFLQDMGLTSDDMRFVIFRIPKGEAYFWTLETNFSPKYKILFGYEPL